MLLCSSQLCRHLAQTWSSPCTVVGYKLYPGRILREVYLVIDFEAFQSIRSGLHIADHDTKEIYVPGTAPDDKELHSFPVRIGAICPLPGDELTVQSSPDSDVPWAEDILSLMDSLDLDPNSTPVLDPSDPMLSSALDEEDYWEVRGLYLYRIQFKLRTTRYSPFELSEMLLWELKTLILFALPR